MAQQTFSSARSQAGPRVQLNALPVNTVVQLLNLSTQQSHHHNGKQARILMPYNRQTERYAIELLDGSHAKGNVKIENIKVLRLPRPPNLSTTHAARTAAGSSRPTPNANHSQHWRHFNQPNQPNHLNHSQTTSNSLYSHRTHPNGNQLQNRINTSNPSSQNPAVTNSVRAKQVATRPRMNTARFFSSSVMRSQQNLLNGGLMRDFESVLNGNCIYIPKFYNEARSKALFNQMLADMRSRQPTEQTVQKLNKNVNEKVAPPKFGKNGIKKNGNNGDIGISGISGSNGINGINGNNGNKSGNEAKRQSFRDRMLFYAKHQKDDLEENKEYFSPAFKEVCDELSEYFDCDIYVTLLNFYEHGGMKIGFHHDGLNHGLMNITVGISFGATRDLCFLHEKSGATFAIPQRNGDVFAFTSVVNNKFKHGVPRTKKSVGPRFSIIIFGNRRSLNERNSGTDERKEKIVTSQPRR